MSIHGCNELCYRADEFHSIQKNYGNLCEQMTEEEMRKFLVEKIQEYARLLEKLE